MNKIKAKTNFMKNLNSIKKNQESNRKENRNNAGFSMIETLVAIFILLIAVTGPMVFAQNALRSAFYARDQITAFYLAQDAIEYVKNRRDHNMLKGAGGDPDRWLDGLNECLAPIGTGCSIDTVANNGVGDITSCDTFQTGCLASSPENDNHLLVDSEGYFNINSGSDSLFSRQIYITEVVPEKEAEIVVRIRWSSHGTIGYREITVVENFYNWPSALGI